MNCLPILVVVALALTAASSPTSALKIQSPGDDLPEKLSHQRNLATLQVGYLNLDDVVSKLYESDNFYGNMELINGMLDSEKGHPSLLKGVKWLHEVVDQFKSLSTVYDRCDYESYKTLAQNYLAVDGRSHELHESRRAIEKMIYDYALEHAKECGPQYVDKFEEISQRPAAKIVVQVVDEVLKGLDADNLLAGEDGAIALQYKPKDVIERQSEGLDLTNYGFHTIVKNIEGLVQGKSEAQFLYPELSKPLVGGELKPKLPSGFEANIFNKYLITPCEQYNELFRDVFAPARFDAMIENEEEVTPMFPSSSERFNTAWIQYRVCKHLTRPADRSDLLAFVKQVAKSLTKQ